MYSKLSDWFANRSVRKHRQSLQRKISQHGWTGTYVFGGGPEDHIDFAYTIGFSDFGAPELLIFSMDSEIINGVFWEYFNAMRSGVELEDGLVFRPNAPEMPGFECTLRSATKAATWSQYVFDSIAYSLSNGRGEKPAVMQVVWPSALNGKYPWHLGCPETVRDHQPALYEGQLAGRARVIGYTD